MNKKDYTEAFLELVRAGLWEQEAQLSQYGDINFEEVLRIAEEQSVVGLVSAGLDHIFDVKPPQEILLKFVGKALQLEHQNSAMNVFISRLIDKMRGNGIYTLLVKGQGIAQCYERPMWRACGDVDLYLSESNYKVAKDFLMPLASNVGGEDCRKLHLNMTVDSWAVELHGTMHSDFSKRMNKVLDEVHQSLFYEGNVRCWNNNGVPVFLPSADNDVVIVFTHFLQHFYVGGVGLRQICDWCRLLWTYRKEIDDVILESRIRKAGLMPEWRAFAALAVEYLGMPVEAMPLYKETSSYKKKAKRIFKMILRDGNLGHNIDESYRAKYSGFKANMITFFRRLEEFARLSLIFPKNGPRFFVSYVLWRMK